MIPLQSIRSPRVTMVAGHGERTTAGLAAARARGRIGGRPPRLSADQIRMAQRQLQDPDLTMTEVAEAFHVSRTTLYRALKKAAQE